MSEKEKKIFIEQDKKDKDKDKDKKGKTVSIDPNSIKNILYDSANILLLFKESKK